MKLSEIYKIADEIAPKGLSDEMCQKYGWYDNSGILVNADEETESIVFSLDLSMGAVDEAIERRAKLIITHHPAIYGKISRIDYEDSALLGTKLIKCIKNGISVIAMHLNLDAAEGGIDESLMQGILLSAGEKAGAGTQPIAKQILLTGGAYGRVYDLSGVTLGELAKGMEKTFATERLTVYGDKEKKVKRVASFCGSGADEGSIAFAVKNGADVMISSDYKHHVLSLAIEAGLSVITLTHYASEEYGFKKYYEKIRQRVEIPCYFHAEDLLR